MENIEMITRTGGFQDNVIVTENEVKKLIKYYAKNMIHIKAKMEI